MPGVFGLVQVCSASLTGDLRTQWEAHLCGLCLTLRDTRGQWARAFTNTDAVMLSVLVEAQQQGTAARVGAGACPLRGMRTAQVVPPSAVAARLGATASLTLAAAKAGDLIGERRHGLDGRADLGGRVRRRAVAAAAEPLRRAAELDAPMAAAAHTTTVITDLSGQADREYEVGRAAAGSTGGTASWRLLESVLAPTASATARIFRASAELAGRPGNADELTTIGAAFGALAHLLDAVTDLDRDAAAGAFNPLAVTGVALPEVRRRCLELVRTIRVSFDTLDLTDDRLIRRLLVDGSHAAVHRAFGESASCGTGHRPAPAVATGPGNPPPAVVPEPNPSPPQGDPAAPPGPDPHTEPPATKPPQPRGFWPALLPWIGVYCTGVACCAEHENPCTGTRHDSAISRACGNCGSCDGNCASCCECCDCCEGGCCCDC